MQHACGAQLPAGGKATSALWAARHVCDHNWASVPGDRGSRGVNRMHDAAGPARRALGASGLQIAPLAFGGNVFGWTADEATSFRLLDTFVDAGFNLLDTADV